MAPTRRPRTKRTFDFTVAAISMPLVLPLIALLGIAVRLETKGPAIFRQRRIGINGKEFTIYKLRTMRTETADVPTHETSTADVTRVGSFIRRTKFDELPQLINVLRGEMSLVGPRPCLPSQTDLIEARQTLKVDELRPGITGISQLEGIDMADADRLAISDARYLDSWSLVGDIRLVVATVTGGGSGDFVSTGSP